MCFFTFQAADDQRERLRVLSLRWIERVALLGGQITFESAPGAGTQITFELPAACEPAEVKHGG